MAVKKRLPARPATLSHSTGSAPGVPKIPSVASPRMVVRSHAAVEESAAPVRETVCPVRACVPEGTPWHASQMSLAVPSS